jgi:prolyl oligopeptidase
MITVAGVRLLWALVSLGLVGAALYAADQSSSSSASAAAGPPLAEVKPMMEVLHGTKIIDNYRWLEDGANPETVKWVASEMGYTRAVLDPLPGRDAIHKRLTELLSIGSVTTPQVAGKYYFYTRREGMQNQPVLYVREANVSAKDTDKDQGKDRVLVDANALAADGTMALDWFEPSNNGKDVA